MLSQNPGSAPANESSGLLGASVDTDVTRGSGVEKFAENIGDGTSNTDKSTQGVLSEVAAQSSSSTALQSGTSSVPQREDQLAQSTTATNLVPQSTPIASHAQHQYQQQQYYQQFQQQQYYQQQMMQQQMLQQMYHQQQAAAHAQYASQAAVQQQEFPDNQLQQGDQPPYNNSSEFPDTAPDNNST